MAEVRLAFLLAVLFLVVFGMTGRLGFLSRECPTLPRRIAGTLLLISVLGFTVFYPLASTGEAARVDVENLWFPQLFVGHAVIVAFLFVWWLLTGRPPVRRYLSLPRRDLRAVARSGIAAGCIGWVFAIAGTSIIASLAGLVDHGAAQPSEPPDILLWLAHLSALRKLVVVTIAMTVEEAFFRAFLQTRFGMWPSSILFAIAHFSYGLPYLVIGVLTISLVIAVVFQRTGHLLACVAAHGVFDSIQLFIILPAIVELVT